MREHYIGFWIKDKGSTNYTYLTSAELSYSLEQFEELLIHKIASNIDTDYLYLTDFDDFKVDDFYEYSFNNNLETWEITLIKYGTSQYIGSDYIINFDIFTRVGSAASNLMQDLFVSHDGWCIKSKEK